ncbi:uncharacterized protein [Musca autumnalis]|uniref:uncharacterized protein n=1 Tax=Musca autumnalis TaxID=221902 RepID=UPI003CE6DC87
MSLLNACRLCKNICDDSIRLCDENGKFSEAYLTTIKFFPPSFLEIENGEPDPFAVLCEECWHHIFTFNDFQTNVILSKEKYLKNLELEHTISHNKLPPDPNIDTAVKPADSSHLDYKSWDIINVNPTPSVYANSDTISIAGTLKDTSDEEMEDDIIEESKYEIQSSIPYHFIEKTQISNDPQAENLPTTTELSSLNDFGKRKRTAREMDVLIQQWIPTLDCYLCRITFTSFSDLSEHFAVNHADKKLYVKCCGRKFEFRCRLASHVHAHLNRDLFHCPRCKQCFALKSRWQNHITYSECGKGTANETNTMELNETSVDDVSSDIFTKSLSPNIVGPNDGDNDGANTICYVSPSVVASVVNTSEDNHNEDEDKKPQLFDEKPSFATQIPDFSESNAISAETDFTPSLIEDIYMKLKKHRTSSELDEIIRQFKPTLNCILCNIECTTFSILAEHFDTSHPLEKMFVKCCGRRFRYRSQLVDHCQMHQNPQRPQYECDTCHKTFTRKTSLKNHKYYVDCGGAGCSGSSRPKKVETQKRPLKLECRICHRIFHDRPKYEEHVSKHRAEKEHICRYCKKVFAYRSSLVRHITTNFMCHARSGGGRKRKGKKADRTCKICSKVFIHRSRMLRHLKVMHRKEEDVEGDEIKVKIETLNESNEVNICKSE